VTRGPLARVGLLVLAGVLWAVRPGAGQVAGSKHDFSGQTAGTAESGECTFCHTPHKAYETSLGWNHTLTGTLYSWSKLATDSGTPYPTISATWSGSARLCLSCHDGSTAIGAIAWFNGQSWAGAPIDPSNHNGDSVQIGTATGDLTNNHPVAFPFPYAGVPSTYNGVTTSAGALAAGWQPDPTAIGIRLFKQAGGQVTAGTAAGATGIECSSCHDPHDNPADVEDGAFLRGSTNASDPNYICTKCHLVMGDYKADASLNPHFPRLP